MPSTILGFQSGGLNILSGSALWSGTGFPHPVGGVQLKASIANSGAIYVGFSGGITITSGLWFLSGNMGSGLMDGMPLYAGESYFCPKLACGVSGFPQIYVNPDAACSGNARLFWEAF